MVDKVATTGKLLQCDFKEGALQINIHMSLRVQADKAGMNLCALVQTSQWAALRTSKISAIAGYQCEIVFDDVLHEDMVLDAEPTAVAYAGRFDMPGPDCQVHQFRG